jgi:hypothetical protein
MKATETKLKPSTHEGHSKRIDRVLECLVSHRRIFERRTLGTSRATANGDLYSIEIVKLPQPPRETRSANSSQASFFPASFALAMPHTWNYFGASLGFAVATTRLLRRVSSKRIASVFGTAMT